MKVKLYVYTYIGLYIDISNEPLENVRTKNRSLKIIVQPHYFHTCPIPNKIKKKRKRKR